MKYFHFSIILRDNIFRDTNNKDYQFIEKMNNFI